MAFDTIFSWLLILAFCELAVAASTASLLGSGAVIILAVCSWLTRFDLDLLAFLLAATYGSVLVCLTLVQASLEGYPGLAFAPSARTTFFLSDILALAVFAAVSYGSSGDVSFVNFFVDLYQGQGDWLEQVVGAFHVFFYKTAVLEAVLLNLFLLLALVASLSILSTLGSMQGSREDPLVRGISRIRVVRSFRRQVRRKNSSQIRSAKS